VSTVTDDNWLGIGPAAVTGFSDGSADRGSGGVTSGVDNTATTAAGPAAPLWSPDNPLFWLAGLLLAAGGLIYVSGHVKAGPLSATASI
jgi:hypothetical protein